MTNEQRSTGSRSVNDEIEMMYPDMCEMNYTTLSRIRAAMGNSLMSACNGEDTAFQREVLIRINFLMQQWSYRAGEVSR